MIRELDTYIIIPASKSPENRAKVRIMTDHDMIWYESMSIAQYMLDYKATHMATLHATMTGHGEQAVDLEAHPYTIVAPSYLL